MKVRTRVAPSPTGDPHVGTAYMALFSYCFAKKHGGDFILRIEDTDSERSSPEAEKKIMDALDWLGLSFDEGPSKEGRHAPYRQSERLRLYKKYSQELLASGNAFRCFCTRDRLEELRKSQMSEGKTTRYDGLCLNLAKSEIAQKISNNVPHVVRMRVPDNGNCVVNDELRGVIEIAWDQVDMQVLMKTDGTPTYHFAVVVDDHLMEITHIIRGEEWINSAPKHIKLYEYFGWEMPSLIHMPLLRNPDKSKLSKRKNPTAIDFYKDMGFLPEALLNYLGMLGWSMPGGEEKFSLDEMVADFELSRITLGAPIFDIEKLKWLNGVWLRSYDEEKYREKLISWFQEKLSIESIIPLVKERIDIFTEMAPLTSFFLDGMPSIATEDFDSMPQEREDIVKILQFSLWCLEGQRDWSKEIIHDSLISLADNMKLKVREFLRPIFIAISGKPVSPPLFDSMTIIGPDICKARLKHSIELLGGVSKKQTKKLEKIYRDIKVD